MKKFLEFIWELIGPLVMFLLGMIIFGWALSLFGLLFLFEPTTPIWLKWTIGVFDSFCLIMVMHSWIHGAWERVYKQN